MPTTVDKDVNALFIALTVREAIIIDEIESVRRGIDLVMANAMHYLIGEAFARIVRWATQKHDVPPVAIADEFDVTPPTISRWSRGKNLPKPRDRRQVIEWIEKTLEKQLESLEATLKEVRKELKKMDKEQRRKHG